MAIGQDKPDLFIQISDINDKIKSFFMSVCITVLMCFTTVIIIFRRVYYVFKIKPMF